MDKKAWIIFGAVVVVLFGGLIWYSQASQVSINVSNVDATKITSASTANGNIADHVEGSTAQKVTIIEYGDYECPYCGEAYPQLKTIMDNYSANVTFIFRNFPLSTIHPNALAAAAVAEAAGLQGKYWQMHDLLYTNQSEWESLTGTPRTDAFNNYASSLGLNMTKFTSDLSSKAVTDKIAFDRALGTKVGVASTPSIYVDGTIITDAVNQDLEQGTGSQLESLLNNKLKAAGLPVPTINTTATASS